MENLRELDLKEMNDVSGGGFWGMFLKGCRIGIPIGAAGAATYYTMA